MVPGQYLYGLANGSRGTLVGVVYGQGGVGSFPEAVVVEIPEYCGPAFYPGEPKWVPLLPMTSHKEGTRLARTQFPIVAGFALTVNKAQGLTIKERKGNAFWCGDVRETIGLLRFQCSASTPKSVDSMNPIDLWARPCSLDETLI